MIHKAKAGAPRVLVVDDEIPLLESILDLLRKNYDVYATNNAEEAISLLEKEDIALILTDQRMPAMVGYELLARATKISPDTIRILFTAYSDIEAVIQAVNKGQIFRYLSKPWEPERLLEIVHAAIEKHSLISENRRLVKELSFATDTAFNAQDIFHAAHIHGDLLAKENEKLQASLENLKNSYWHLKKVRELLPICMECGKVEVNKENWLDLTEYIRNNSLFLTHTYCPTCEKKVVRDI